MNIPLSAGQKVIDKNYPGHPGEYTGRHRPLGTAMMVEIKFPNGSVRFRPLTELEIVDEAQLESIPDQLINERFESIQDLKRLITYEKLKGTLHEIIYSMEAAQIDFFPYQFKPVLKFINSPTERLVLADEVGLGKTIESGLIWLEMQARYQSNRLLVICPKILAEKWREELRDKFLLDAKIVNFKEFKTEIEELKKVGPDYPFALISTYTGLRPSTRERDLLDIPIEEEVEETEKTHLLRELKFWEDDSYAPIDMLIFDEAHYMRNPATTTYHLGESLASRAKAVLCVSATPVNNSNIDLHSLLKIVDEDFFEAQANFQDLIDNNKPTVLAGNALSRNPINRSLLDESVAAMRNSNYIRNSALFRQFLKNLDHLKEANYDDSGLRARCQNTLEKLNLLGGYINRTRRAQVKESRPVREVLVPIVQYTEEEMELYLKILSIVRERCKAKGTELFYFEVIGLQLMAASCLPAFVERIRAEHVSTDENLIQEALGGGLDATNPVRKLNFPGLSDLLRYDFEGNDSKFYKLLNVLHARSGEKVIIFAYYRSTLAYLRRRLMMEGESVATIHGGVATDERWKEIDRFKSDDGPRILLASEVGSEGIDLQFCRVLINYDLPWNPMRVEQRIGRIDRVGQQAKKLTIVNFKVAGTIEERLHERLHEKLEKFSNSLGDLDEVLGKEVRMLTLDLLSKELTAEQENARIEQTQLAIENKLSMMKMLEESGEALVALSDYVQKKVEEDRDRGRYIQASEIEDYLADFFGRFYPGTEINYNTPTNGCLRLRFSDEAHASLRSFIGGDRSLNARPFRRQELLLTFSREVSKALPSNLRRQVHFVNHLSPLIRWITKSNKDKDHEFHKLSALKVCSSAMKPGVYLYSIERWIMQGITNVEKLAYGFISLDTGEVYSSHDSELVFQTMLQEGQAWPHREYNSSVLGERYAQIEEYMYQQFNEEFGQFEVENDSLRQIKEQRIISIFDRRIEQDQKRLQTATLKGREEKILNMARGRLQKAKEIKATKLAELSGKASVVPDMSPVAAGLVLIHS